MNDPWMKNEWSDLCQRVARSADLWGSKSAIQAEKFRSEAEAFTNASLPERYPDLLERVRVAARMAVSWSERVDPPASSDGSGIPDEIDEAGIESFPASDPPAWTVSRV